MDPRAGRTGQRKVRVMSKIKPFIGPVVVTIIVMVAVNRIGFLRNLVYGAPAN